MKKEYATIKFVAYSFLYNYVFGRKVLQTKQKGENSMNCKFHVDTKVYRLEPYENYVRITGWCLDIENRNIEFFIKMNG